MSILNNEVDAIQRLTTSDGKRQLINILSTLAVESLEMSDEENLVKYVSFNLIDLKSDAGLSLRCAFRVHMLLDGNFSDNEETLVETDDRVSYVVPVGLLNAKKEQELFDYCCSIEDLLRMKSPLESFGDYLPFSFLFIKNGKSCNMLDEHEISSVLGGDKKSEDLVWRVQENFLKHKEVLFDYRSNSKPSYMDEFYPSGSISGLLNMVEYRESYLRYFSLLGKYGHCASKLEKMLSIISNPVKDSKNLPHWSSVALNLYCFTAASSLEPLSKSVIVRSIHELSKDKQVSEDSILWERIKFESEDSEMFKVKQHLNDCCVTINVPQFMQSYLHWEGKEDSYKRLFMMGFSNFTIDRVLNPFNKLIVKEFNDLLKPLDVSGVSEMSFDRNARVGFPDTSMTVSFSGAKDDHTLIVKNLLEYSFFETKKHRLASNMSFYEEDVNEREFRQVTSAILTGYIISEKMRKLDEEDSSNPSGEVSGTSFKI